MRVKGMEWSDDVGVWNWDDNHYLANIKVFPLAWRTLLRAVYNRNGSPARDYILTSIYANQDQLRAAYGKVPAVIGDHVETIFSDVQKIQKSSKKMMEMTAIPPSRLSRKNDTSDPSSLQREIQVIQFGKYNTLRASTHVWVLQCGDQERN
jgi:hypothetical protein